MFTKITKFIWQFVKSDLFLFTENWIQSSIKVRLDHSSGPKLILHLFQVIPIAFVLAPFAMVPFYLHRNIGAPFVLYKIAGGPKFPDNFWLNLVTGFGKFIYLSFGITETLRTFSCITVFGMQRLIYFKSYLYQISELLPYCAKKRTQIPVRCAQVISTYQKLHIIFQWDKYTLNWFAGVYFLADFFILLIANFVTLKMYNLLPFYFYLVFPFFAGAILVETPIGYFFLEIGDVAEIVVKQMNQLQGFVKVGKIRNFLRKKIKSIAVIRAPAGIGNSTLFFIRGAAMCDFYYNILDNTINLLLSVNL